MYLFQALLYLYQVLLSFYLEILKKKLYNQIKKASDKKTKRKNPEKLNNERC